MIILYYAKRTLIYCFLIFLCGSITGSLLTATGQLPLRSDGDNPNCIVRCKSTDQVKPVCGTDGRTYLNRCELQQARCDGHLNVRIHKRGKCPEAARCLAERRHAQRQARRSSVFVPHCEEDGSYSQVQCHAGTGYCWCASHLGRPVPGSSVRFKRPDCKALQHTGKPLSKRRSSPDIRASDREIKKHSGRNRSNNGESCAENEHNLFNLNLIKLFLAEYNMISTPRPDQGDGLTKEEIVVRWKFNTLDTNQNSGLEKKEIKQFKRMVKKFVVPLACGRHFVRHCDVSKDGFISLSEWTACLKYTTEKHTTEKSEHVEIPNSELRPLWSEPARPHHNEDDSHDCPRERQSAQDQQVASGSEVYIPECTPDGLYSRIQCFKSTGYCWCANATTGKPMPGTSVKNQKPSCDKVRKLVRGCPASRINQFLRELNELIQQTTNTSSSIRPSDRKSSQFSQIDKNQNKMLDRSEWKQLKAMLRQRHSMRSCVRHFFRYCDVNSDRKISEHEWTICTLIQAEPSKPPKRFGQNPLDKYLRPN